MTKVQDSASDVRAVVTVALYDMAATWNLPQPNISFGEGRLVLINAATGGDATDWATALGLAVDGAVATGEWQGWTVAVSS